MRDEDSNLIKSELIDAAKKGRDAVDLYFRSNSYVVGNEDRVCEGGIFYVAAEYIADTKTCEWLIDLLLEHGARITPYTDDYSFGALEKAISAGRSDIAKILLDVAGMDVNKTNGEGNWFALAHAARAGMADIVSILLARGADVNRLAFCEDGYDGPALSFAAFNSHKDVVEILLAHENVDVSLSWGNNMTPLDYAVVDAFEKNKKNKENKENKENIETVVCILNAMKKSKISLENKLYLAMGQVQEYSINPSEKIARILLEYGAKIYDKDYFSWNEKAKEFAKEKNCEETIDGLLEKKWDVNFQGKYGITLSMVAAQNGNKEHAQKLVDANANLEITNEWKETAIIMAARGGQSENTEIAATECSHADTLEILIDGRVGQILYKTGPHDNSTASTVSAAEESDTVKRKAPAPISEQDQADYNEENKDISQKPVKYQKTNTNNNDNNANDLVQLSDLTPNNHEMTDQDAHDMQNNPIHSAVEDNGAIQDAFTAAEAQYMGYASTMADYI